VLSTDNIYVYFTVKNGSLEKKQKEKENIYNTVRISSISSKYQTAADPDPRQRSWS